MDIEESHTAKTILLQTGKHRKNYILTPEKMMHYITLINDSDSNNSIGGQTELQHVCWTIHQKLNITTQQLSRHSSAALPARRLKSTGEYFTAEYFLSTCSAPLISLSDVLSEYESQQAAGSFSN